MATELELIPLSNIWVNTDPRMTSIRQRAPTPVSSQDSSSQLGVGGLPPVESSHCDFVHERWSTITNPKQYMRIRARRRMRNLLKEARNHHAYIHPESQRTRKAHAEGRARGPRGKFLPKWESPMLADHSM